MGDLDDLAKVVQQRSTQQRRSASHPSTPPSAPFPKPAAALPALPPVSRHADPGATAFKVALGFGGGILTLMVGIFFLVFLFATVTFIGCAVLMHSSRPPTARPPAPPAVRPVR